jgi:[ribosomal protein S18]-alanine N-acetyltransferase
MQIRRADASDIAGIERVQASSPEAAHWKAAQYLDYDCWVAIADDRVAGFLVSRAIVDEREILNVAVDPEVRRRGIGEALIRRELDCGAHAWFLEVRQSNETARRLYGRLGFIEASRRRGYYDSPREDAIVMTKFS